MIFYYFETGLVICKGGANVNINLTSDQYNALNTLEYWYRKGSHQFIDMSGPIYTGTWDVLQVFLDTVGLDSREVMYLSYDQKQVHELAYNRYHCYHVYGYLYKYDRNVNIDSIPVVNSSSNKLEYTWTKRLRKKIDNRYRLIVVLDASLMNESTLWDISEYGLPVILIRDPYLLPAPDSYIYMRDPNITLEDASDAMMKNPVNVVSHSIITGQKLNVGSFSSASIIRRKDLHMYNLKSSSMNLTLSEEMRDTINTAYRSNMKRSPQYTYTNERVYVSDSHYSEIITNSTEKHVKVYLMKGITGYLSKVYRHAAITRYVGCEFTPDFYHEPFTELYMDRDHLYHRETNSRQMIPDDVVKFEYAYALTPLQSRMNHWDDVTLIMERPDEYDDTLMRMMMYTAVTRASKTITIVV